MTRERGMHPTVQDGERYKNGANELSRIGGLATIDMMKVTWT